MCTHTHTRRSSWRHANVYAQTGTRKHRRHVHTQGHSLSWPAVLSCAWRQLHQGQTSTHRGSRTHSTHTHTPKPTLVHMQAQEQRRHTQKHLEHRTQGSQRRASTRPSPTLPESRSHPGSPPHQPSAAQPYLGDLRGSWDPRDPDSLGQQQSRARSACLSQPWVRMGLRLPHSGSCSCSFSDARPDAAAWCGAGGGEATAPLREGPCRLEEGAPGWRRTDARTRVHPQR